MALRVTGSKLVAEGAAKYINQMRQAGKATGDIEKGADRAGKGLSRLNAISSIIAVTLGNLASSVIQNAIRGLMNLAKESVNAVASFERLEMSMESLVARELRVADSTLIMEDALAAAAPIAQDLLAWIQKLAIESPFDMTGVAVAFRTAQAYGFTAAEAQKLTQVTIDFASATGATVEVMNRMSLALGQIKAKGKLAGQEILQLVNAGVNVTAILDKMGFTLNDVSSGLVSADAFLKAFTDTMEDDFGGAAARQTETLSGLLNALGDIKEIMLRDFFRPVFESALPFLAAFTTKLQELLPIIQLLGGYIGRFTAFLLNNRVIIMQVVAALGAAAIAFLLVTNAQLIMAAAAAVASGALALVGAALAFLLSPIGLIAAAVAGLAALFVFAFSDIQAKTGSFFGNMKKDLFGFGRDIILQFAEGMASAINVVLDVLIAVGNAIAYWLQSLSPPRLLPDISKWGTGAMNAYLEGFTLADFGIFDSISRTMEGYLRSLVRGIPETELIPRILGTRTAIAEALETIRKTGSITEAAIQKILGATGLAGNALESYVRALFKAAEASRAVKEAQDALNKVFEKYDALLKPINDELSKIDKRRQEIIDNQRKAELEAILSDESAPALVKELALMELREIELRRQADALQEEGDLAATIAGDKLDAAKKEEEAALEKLALQEAMIDAQVENNRLLKEQIALLKGLAGAGGGGAGAGAGGGLAEALEKAQSAAASASSGIGAALSGLQGKLDGFFQEISDKFAGIGEKLQTLKATWAEVFIEMGLRVASFGLNVIAIWQNILSLAGMIVGRLIQIFLEWAINFIKTWNDNFDLAKQIIAKFSENTRDEFEKAGGWWKEQIDIAWTLIKKAMNLSADEVIVIISTMILDVIAEFEAKRTEFVAAGANIVLGIIQGIEEKKQQMIQKMLDLAREAWEAVERFFEMDSASKKTRKGAHDIAKGLVLGMHDKLKMLHESGKSMGEAMSDGLKDGLDHMVGHAHHAMSEVGKTKYTPSPGATGSRYSPSSQGLPQTRGAGSTSNTTNTTTNYVTGAENLNIGSGGLGVADILEIIELALTKALTTT